MKNKSKDLAKKRLVKTVKKDRALNRDSRKVAKKLALELGLVTALVCMTSCSGVVTFASTEGIRAQNDGTIGLVEQAKADKDKKTAYWQNQDLKATTKSWGRLMLEKLTPNKGGK